MKTGKITTFDFITILIIVIISLIPRVIFLTVAPDGLHGDEAWAGIWARRLLSTGSIETYTGDALGNVTGPVYLVTLLFGLSGDSVLSIRLASVISAVLSIPLMYVFLRLNFSRFTSASTTIVYSFLPIIFYFSRTGFFLIHSMIPLLGALIFYSLYSRYFGYVRYILLFLCGVCLALGIYSYNAFPLTATLFICAIFAGIFVSKHRLRSLIESVLIILIVAVLIYPLLRKAVTEPDFYFAHHKTFAITSARGFVDTSSKWGSLWFVADNGLNKLNNFFIKPKIDGADGYGTERNIPVPYLIAMGGGLVMAIVRRRIFPIFAVFVLLLSSFATIDGIYRRIITVIPFLVFFIAEFIELLRRYFHRYHFITNVAIAIFITSISILTVYTYFAKIVSDSGVKSVFSHDLFAVLDHYHDIRGSDPSQPALFLSARWSCDYESVRYLYPEYRCDDRSEEFGNYSFTDAHPYPDIILLDKYLTRSNDLKSIYPHVSEYPVYDNGEVIGIIYTTQPFKETF